MNHLYILLTILLTVYGQLVIKWQVNLAGSLPHGLADKFLFLGKLLLNPWIISSLAAAFLAAMAWMGAMSKFQLSYAYPFMSLAFVLVLLCSNWFFDEPLTLHKLLGVTLIFAGLVVSSRG